MEFDKFEKLDQYIDERQDPKEKGANLPAESPPKSSLYSKINQMPGRHQHSGQSFIRQQSIMDPDKK